jgi:hypothetical protein
MICHPGMGQEAFPVLRRRNGFFVGIVDSIGTLRTWSKLNFQICFSQLLKLKR